MPPGGRKHPHQPKEERPPAFIPVSDTLQCRFHGNAWHLLTLKPLPFPYFNRARSRDVDVWLNRPVAGLSRLEARKHYGAEVYAVAKRQLARRELRQYPIPSRWWR